MNDTPKLVGTLTEDGRAVRVWCDRCRGWHLHGGFGHKIAHCYSYNRDGSRKGYTSYEVVRPEEKPQ